MVTSECHLIAILYMKFYEGRGKGGLNHFSRKIKWPFHVPRKIKQPFYVSRKIKWPILATNMKGVKLPIGLTDQSRPCTDHAIYHMYLKDNVLEER